MAKRYQVKSADEALKCLESALIIDGQDSTKESIGHGYCGSCGAQWEENQFYIGCDECDRAYYTLAINKERGKTFFA